MKLYHVTTPHKLERYIGTGAILPPVRGWRYLKSAQEWARKTGRSLIVEIESDVIYPLPDHKPLYHSYWTPEIIRKWKVLENNLISNEITSE